MQYGYSITGKQLMWRVFLPIVLMLLGCTNYNSNNYIGAEFLGAKYITDPLGEGFAPDNDPLIRYDAFDCTTFVETALADGDVHKLTKIRYKNAIPNILNRNHFIETDWIENNSNIVKNISRQYAPVQTHKITIDKQKWFKTVYGIDTNFPVQNVVLEYIPYAEAKNITVDKPVIILFVSNSARIRNKIGTDLGIRHMGFLLPNGKLRHASRNAKRVLDVDFQEYVNRMLENKNNLGIILLEIKK